MQHVIPNRQRTKKINAPLLRQIAAALLAELEIDEAELGINLVGARKWRWSMKRFFSTKARRMSSRLTIGTAKREARSGDAWQFHGELFICVDEAVAQAKNFIPPGSRKWCVTSSTAFCICWAMMI